MARKQDWSRRDVVRRSLVGILLTPIVGLSAGVSRAAQTGTAPQKGTVDLPLLSPDDPAAQKVKYTEDASKSQAASKDNKCGNCALYEGTYNSTRGPCQIFPGKHVKAAGWCSSWTPQI